MAARRKAHEADARRIDAIFRRIGAHQPHGALGILQRHVAAILPAFARQAVAQHKTGDARRIEMPRHIHAFEIQHLAANSRRPAPGSWPSRRAGRGGTHSSTGMPTWSMARSTGVR